MDVYAIRRVSICLDDKWTAGTPGEGPGVLIVTPDGNLREVLRRVLEQRGYHVADAAHSGHALLACLTGAPIDAAIVESELEDVSGRTLVEKLRRHQPGLRAVYLAPSGSPAAADVAVRPLTSDAVLETLEAVTSLAAF